MPSSIDEIVSRLRALEEELQAELAVKRHEIEFAIEDRRVRFPMHVLHRQSLYKIGLLRFLRSSRWRVAMTAPIVYAGFLPFGLMDIFVTVYERLCFPVFGIARVRRGDYMVFDRVDLPYLNAIEKFNCFYCSYANGVAAFLREVAARTEQYWCPIKHARRLLSPHEAYPKFFEFGDGQAYRQGLKRLQRQYGSKAPISDPPAP